MPRHSRHVGQALKFLSPTVQPPVPWYRVVSSAGTISSRGPGTNGAELQRQELEAEGVEVAQTRGGELKVDFGRWGWFPAPGTVDTGVEVAGDGPDGDAQDAQDAEEEAGDNNQQQAQP